MKDLWILFWTFARIGCFTFGGGYAMLPMLQKEIVDKYHWTTEEDLMDCYAIGQCTPGVIAVNTATYIGYKQKKTLGALAATLGMIFPSLVIIMLIAAVLSNFNEIVAVQHAFAGIRIIVAVLVINVVIKMFKTSIKDWVGILIFIMALLIGLLFNLSPIYTILASALIGILSKTFRGGKEIQ